MTFQTLSTVKSHGGIQGVHSHMSRETGTEMVFSVYLPPQAAGGARMPVVWYLSGLTCTHANVTEKGEYRRACAELGLIFVAPDTSPRGDKVPDDEAYDFGKGAGFYVDATRAPFADNFRMYSYVVNELPELIAAHFPADMERQAIMGHSMGGHGALTIALRNPETFRSVSALSPIVSPMRVPWGEKALAGYLDDDRQAWRAYDATALIEDGRRVAEILVDQGDADTFLADQLKPELLADACSKAGIKLTLRVQPGYDHSYYFISSFMEDHLRYHARRMSI